MAWRMLLPLAVLQGLFVGGQGTNGAATCPCLTTSSGIYQQVRTNMTARGFPADYGFGGCGDWDQGLAAPGIDCDDGAANPGYCSSHWCYVDTALCAADFDACRALGLFFNDPGHPSCRSRPAHPSLVLPGSGLFYSYETCGYRDDYDIDNLFESMRGTLLLGAAPNDPPYVSVETVQDTNDPNGAPVVAYSGVEFSFVQKVLEHLTCPTCALKVPPTLRMVDGWASEASRSRFSSSYTACVNDVAVGLYDICIGDFWVTTERMLMTLFLPSIRSDQFYLVVFAENTQINLQTLLQNPFLPFSGEAWGIIFGIIVFLTVSMAILDYSPEDDEEEVVKQPFYRWLKRVWWSFFYAWCSVFSGKSSFRAKSLSSQVASMFFQTFVLVVVASYKAKLASLLILSSIGAGVDSIDGAILKGYTICIPSAIETTVRLNYPNADFFPFSGSSADFARHMHSGKCDAAVIHSKRILQMQAGWIKSNDCKKVREGALSEEEGRCETSVAMAERDDCQLVQVGEMILSIPVAFPIKMGSLLTPMSVALTKAQNAGEWQKAIKDNKDLYPKSQCNDRAPGQRLGKEAFAGVSILVGLGVFVAMALHKAQDYAHWWPMLVPKKHAATEEELDEQQKQMMDMLAKMAQVTKSLEADTRRRRAASRTASAGQKNASFISDSHNESIDASDGNMVKIKCESGVVSGGEFVPAKSPALSSQPGGPPAMNGNGTAGRDQAAGGVAPLLGSSKMQYPAYPLTSQ